jgi:ferredoxin
MGRRFEKPVMSTESAERHEIVFVEPDETTTTVTLEPDESLLDAARRESVDLRWGCTEGECTSCTSRLVEGEVSWLSDPKALDDDRTDDYISLCLTRPESDCRIRVGDDVLVDAFPRVWGNLDTDSK